MKKNKSKYKKVVRILLYVALIVLGVCFNFEKEDFSVNNSKVIYNISNIPEYNGEIYVELNGNLPEFTNEDMNITEDYYSSLENGRVRYGYDKNLP